MDELIEISRALGRVEATLQQVQADVAELKGTPKRRWAMVSAWFSSVVASVVAALLIGFGIKK